MTLWHGADTFTDVFLLVHAGGHWRIANKAYHRRGTAAPSRHSTSHPATEDPAPR
jgi:hypothetical protein